MAWTTLARAASDQATIAGPRSDMNSRRLMDFLAAPRTAPFELGYLAPSSRCNRCSVGSSPVCLGGPFRFHRDRAGALLDERSQRRPGRLIRGDRPKREQGRTPHPTPRPARLRVAAHRRSHCQRQRTCRSHGRLAHQRAAAQLDQARKGKEVRQRQGARRCPTSVNPERQTIPVNSKRAAL